MQHIDKPQEGEYAPYAITYINQMPDDGEVLKHLIANFDMLNELLLPLTDEQLLYRYAPGKWSIKEVLLHMIDTERIFACRTLRIARNDKTALPGFEQDDYTLECFANQRSIDSIMHEYETVRAGTLSLYENLPDETATRSTMVNNYPTTVRALAYMIAGHEQHHINIIRERYLAAE